MGRGESSDKHLLSRALFTTVLSLLTGFLVRKFKSALGDYALLTESLSVHPDLEAAPLIYRVITLIVSSLPSPTGFLTDVPMADPGESKIPSFLRKKESR